MSEVLNLLKLHSQLYIIKFFALIALAFMSTIVLTVDHHGLFVTALTFVASLLFDQIAKNKLDENFDFKKVGNLCNMGIVYISIIFIIVLCFLIAGNLIKQSVPLLVCKVSMFIICFVASFSALIEGVANLPPQVLPAQQEKSND